jgi:hypothetical protein
MKNWKPKKSTIAALIAIILFSCGNGIDSGPTSPALEHSVTYYGNGNTQGIAPAGIRAASGRSVVISENTGNLMKIGNGSESYAFSIWNTMPDGSGVSCASGSELTLTDDISLYAQYGDFQLEDMGPAGGLVFYDKGSFSDGWRYMEAAPSDQSGGLSWCGSDYRTRTTGVTATAIGTGENNTQSLVFQENADWFLPGKDGLYAMYSNLYLNGSGGFTLGDEYWSSSEVDSVRAYTQKFNSVGYQNLTTKYSSLTLKRVRAVRTFKWKNN